MREWLRQKRIQLSYTQEQIADLLNISRAYYTQIELGNRTPSPKVAQKLAKILEIEWTDFFENID